MIRKNTYIEKARPAEIIDFILDAILAIDLSGTVIAWNKAMEELSVNPAFARLFGYNSPQEMIACVTDIGQQLYNNPKDRERAIKQIIEQGYLEGFELEVHRRDGTKFWVSMNTRIVRDEDGLHYDGTVEDITKRKRAEDMLRAAKEVAEAATKSKSDFLANMSHEIRTPMNAVIGMTCLLLDEELTAIQKDYVETIRSSGEALLDIINDILDISKIEGGMMEMEHQPFSLQRCIEESIELGAENAAKKGLEMEYEIEQDIPDVVLGDYARLRQVLINLIGNAVKFTEKGCISIFVSGGKSDDGSYEIHFAVKDSGIGIPDDKADRLFQLFSQVDASTARRYGGTGLGLAISKKLVQMMNGRIWAESRPGIGSIFHFTIKVQPTQIALADEGKRASSIKAVSQDQDPPLRILLAEDNLINQRVALHMLAKLGLMGDVASNGQEVLQALESHRYDVILMDVQMPEMDGLETTKTIRKMWPDGPRIIAMTAAAFKSDREMCIDAGMDDYIRKPVRIDELAAALKSFPRDDQV